MEQRKKSGKLFLLILAVLFVVSIVPMSIVSFFMYNRTTSLIKKEILEDNFFVLDNVEHNISDIFKKYEQDVIAFAKNYEKGIRAGETQKNYINDFYKFNRNFSYVSVLDSNGKELLRGGEKYKIDYNKTLFPINSQDYVNYIGRLLVGDLQKIKNERVFINLYTPLIYKNQKRWIAVGLNVSFIDKMTRSYNERESILWALYTKEGEVIASSTSKGVVRGDDEKSVELFKEFNDKETAYTGEMLKINKTLYFSAMKNISKLNWKIYYRKRLNTSSKVYMVVKEGYIWMLVGALAFLILCSYYLALIVVKPIKILFEVATKMGEGRFDETPDLIAPNNEIGDLVLAFGEMMDSLKLKTEKILVVQKDLENANQTLETKVEARTRELKSVLDELIKKERLVTIGQMASIVSHEIRNPLAVIKNSAYLIKTKIDNLDIEDPKVERHLSIIDSEIKQANDIISEILGFARTRDLQLNPNNINAYLRDIISSSIVPDNVEIMDEISEQDAKVNIDAEEIKQAIRNLIGNAVEILAEKDTGKIVVSTKIKANAVKISISDNGPGMDEETKEKIFTPFFTTKARGTGLGLAVVKKAINRHNGKIKVLSKLGKGSIFNIYLPIHNEKSN
ncbi:MAG: HAMP domain-containing protein [Elusimicrobiaceae bacterium]|jgi:signal transduction histidine kinase|nr:HAMP domain-containing protein [Elusimicrobiaceae bacterium]MBT3954643.1 HAMP domain-containing protein [Elusimicrobiaceae bacterium]MBT4007951.1 HAMP domain-containing protein [Elusimicrobiaceae bacterium]MBT4403298.1 HAMP domain-containing protein [Elusimicrobiaceae bacterium]MBT4439965.1 HAMP domain-containing protein [Elusimicrobiaceae bacterium]